MAMTIQCPNPACGVSSNIGQDLSGRNVRCKKCGQPFVAKPTLDGHLLDTKNNQPTAKSNPFPVLPAVFGRYRVLRLLGRGGMGAVYLAEDSQLKRQVALKTLFVGAVESPQRVERFVREAQSAAILQHPNICTVFDAGQIAGQPFLTMTYLPGKPLEDLIDPDHPMDPVRAADIARKIALALDHAHDNGIVHRDLKPANVMMTAQGEPVVMDFGLAKRVAEGDSSEAKLTRDGGILGTPSYMSPEQVKGDISAIGPATDIYSLGVILFEMLTGTTPYTGSMGVVMGQILVAPIPPVREFRPDVDARLDDICQRAMAKNPADRFPSMAVLANALELVGKTPTLTPPPLPVSAAVKALPVPAPVSNPSPFESLLKPEGPISTPRKKLQRPPRKSKSLAAICLIAVGVLGLGAVLAGILLTVRTKHGDVVIEINDPSAKVVVQVDGERIDLTGLDKPLSLTVGEHNMTVSGPDFETVTNSFIVKKGEKQDLKVTLKPKVKETRVDPNLPLPGKPLAKKGEILTNSIGMKLAYIPPGTFLMGSPKEDPDHRTDETEHEVEITKGFYLGLYHVTQGDFEKVMGYNPSNFSAKGGDKAKVPPDTSRFPVEMVSYDQALEFCAKLSASEDEKQLNRLYRLPTEAEWEYACRAGAKTPFNGGPTLSSQQANFNGTVPYPKADKGPFLQRTCQVGAYPANAFGLYDMHGNVWQWCSDWYGDDYYTKSPKQDPKGPATGPAKVIRGGCYFNDAQTCRSARRTWGSTGDHFAHLGFRVVMVPLGQP